jgi:hypothetical protein
MSFAIIIRTDTTVDISTWLPAQKPSRRCVHLEVVGGLVWLCDQESYARGSVATGRVFHAGQVEG